MKRVVLLDDLKESDIRPDHVYSEYKEILENDIKKHFSDAAELVDVNCPGCGANESPVEFKKMGFNFRRCSACDSLYVSPRPKEEDLNRFHKESQSSIFLRNKFLGDTSELRSEKIFSYRIQWIIGLVQEHLPDAKVFLDYVTRLPIFLRELSEEEIFENILSIFSECDQRKKLFPANVKQISEIENESVDVFAISEQIERAFDPLQLIKDAYAACKKGGLCIITTTASSGFEYKVLGEHSPNAMPFEKINILSLDAMIKQLEAVGFEVIEASTPGRLDVEIVKKTYAKNPDIPLGPFERHLLNNGSKEALHYFQEYLQQFQMSSHVRIAAIKR